MFKLNQSKGYRITRSKTAILDILVMSGRLIIRKKQFEKGDFELQGEKD
jgi:Fe2+ or Zn2+ uptake regulation protein